MKKIGIYSSIDVGEVKNKNIDYIFYLKRSNQEEIFSFEADVNKMLIEDEPYERLSDHYAVECKFTYI